MRNYKVDLSGNLDTIYFFQENPLKKKVEVLEKLGFSNTLSCYEKGYGYTDGDDRYNTITMFLYTGLNYMKYEYKGHMLAPSEINTGNTTLKTYRKLLAAMREDIKILKETKILQ